eukprot:9481309-Pyramimonas_sp.AAC.1
MPPSRGGERSEGQGHASGDGDRLNHAEEQKKAEMVAQLATPCAMQVVIGSNSWEPCVSSEFHA